MYETERKNINLIIRRTESECICTLDHTHSHTHDTSQSHAMKTENRQSLSYLLSIFVVSYRRRVFHFLFFFYLLNDQITLKQ